MDYKKLRYYALCSYRQLPEMKLLESLFLGGRTLAVLKYKYLFYERLLSIAYVNIPFKKPKLNILKVSFMEFNEVVKQENIELIKKHVANNSQDKD